MCQNLASAEKAVTCNLKLCKSALKHNYENPSSALERGGNDLLIKLMAHLYNEKIKIESNFFRPYQKTPNDAPFYFFLIKLDKNEHKFSKNWPLRKRFLS